MCGALESSRRVFGREIYVDLDIHCIHLAGSASEQETFAAPNLTVAFGILSGNVAYSPFLQYRKDSSQ